MVALEISVKVKSATLQNNSLPLELLGGFGRLFYCVDLWMVTKFSDRQLSYKELHWILLITLYLAALMYVICLFVEIYNLWPKQSVEGAYYTLWGATIILVNYKLQTLIKEGANHLTIIGHMVLETGLIALMMFFAQFIFKVDVLTTGRVFVVLVVSITVKNCLRLLAKNYHRQVTYQSQELTLEKMNKELLTIKGVLAIQYIQSWNIEDNKPLIKYLILTDESVDFKKLEQEVLLCAIDKYGVCLARLHFENVRAVSEQ